MAIYSLHEMAGLLKTGLWQGGEVEKLGYIGTAVPHASPAPACGLTGVYILSLIHISEPTRPY